MDTHREKSKTHKSFNTTGICNSNIHYMVDLSSRLAQVKILVDEGKYLTINRTRQFGKPTMLHALENHLVKDYFVVSMDIQMQMSSAKFLDENSFSSAFAQAFSHSFRLCSKGNAEEFRNVIDSFDRQIADAQCSLKLVELFLYLSNLCCSIPQKLS